MILNYIYHNSWRLYINIPYLHAYCNISIDQFLWASIFFLKNVQYLGMFSIRSCLCSYFYSLKTPENQSLMSISKALWKVPLFPNISSKFSQDNTYLKNINFWEINFCIYFRGWKFYNPSWWFIFTDGEVLISRGLIFAVGKYVIFMSSMILAGWETNFERISEDAQCVKSVRIRSFSGPYFPAFWLNTENKVLSPNAENANQKNFE